jgi:hypothetical protein
MKEIQQLIEIAQKIEGMMGSCEAMQVDEDIDEETKYVCDLFYDDCKELEELVFILITDMQKKKHRKYLARKLENDAHRNH